MNTPHEIIQLAKRIRDWQQSRNISDADLCRQYAGLGSTKTYKRILDGDLAELEIEDRWLPEYRAVWALMELADAAAPIEEPDYDDLTNVTRARIAVQRAMTERGNNRVVIIEGPPGTGKTAAIRCLAAKWGRRVVIAEADELWTNSPAVMLGSLLRAVGISDVPSNPEERKIKLVEKLRATPTCLIIDDAHHFGPRNLNLCKTLINQCPGLQVILAGVDTLFRRLEKQAYQEARQILNRLGDRVRFETPRESDVAKFLERRGVRFADGVQRRCCGALARRAAETTNWNYVNRVARLLRGREEAVDESTFAAALEEVSRRS